MAGTLLPLKDLVPRLVERLGVSGEGYATLSGIERELRAVHPGAEIVAFRNNKIYVEVESSVELCELNLRRREILKNLARALKPQGAAPALELKLFLRGTARLGARDRRDPSGGIPSRKGNETCLK